MIILLWRLPSRARSESSFALLELRASGSLITCIPGIITYSLFSFHSLPIVCAPKMNAEDSVRKKSRELFGDCALIEIIHLHDCLRGALMQLTEDVSELASSITEYPTSLERRVNGRFKVIWSVFKSHSSAEDEFIWPALREKNGAIVEGGATVHPDETAKETSDTDALDHSSNSQEGEGLARQEYEEDHADEERMFSEMDGLLSQLREELLKKSNELPATVNNVVDKTKKLALHLMNHLDKEETECLPLVAQHLSKEEIHELVGKIMGKRSADTIAQIMTMAVQSLAQEDRDEMVKYMKESMAGVSYFSLRITGVHSPLFFLETCCLTLPLTDVIDLF